MIGGAELQGIVRHFEEIDDPRSAVNRRHPLVDVIVISILGVIAGADGPLAIAMWAKMQEPRLKDHLALPNGVRHSAWRFDGAFPTARKCSTIGATSAVYRGTVGDLRTACAVIGALRTSRIGRWT